MSKIELGDFVVLAKPVERSSGMSAPAGAGGIVLVECDCGGKYLYDVAMDDGTYLVMIPGDFLTLEMPLSEPVKAPTMGIDNPTHWHHHQYQRAINRIFTTLVGGTLYFFALIPFIMMLFDKPKLPGFAPAFSYYAMVFTVSVAFYAVGLATVVLACSLLKIVRMIGYAFKIVVGFYKGY